MATQTIGYTDKVFLNENSSIADINKIKDVDMNEIKSVVNNNASETSTNTTNITNLQTYSTSEVDTKKVWIDGKSIYRKVCDFTTGSANNYAILSDNNIDTFVSMEGFISYGSGYHKIGGYANSSYYSLFQWNSSEHKLYIYYNGYTNKYGYVIIEYTKSS